MVDARDARAHLIVDLGPAPPGAARDHVRNGRLVGEEIRIGSTVYLGGVLAKGQASWTKIDAGAFDSEIIATNPLSELGALRKASDEFRLVGKDIVQDVVSEHYEGTVALGAVKGHWELWIGDGVIRRTRFTSPGDHETTTTEYYDFGAHFEIKPPVTR